MTSSDYFYLNGVSSDTIDLYVDTPPVVPMAGQRYTTWDVGADSDITAEDGEYNDITVKIRAYKFFRTSNFDFSDIYAFLANPRMLKISRHADFYLKVQQIKGITPAQKYDGNRVQFDITFVCSPFKYLVENDPVTLTNTGIVVNPGTFYSRPVYTLTNCNNVSTLTVNGENTVVDQTALGVAYSHTVIVDAEKMIVHDGNGTNLMPYTAGKLPFFAVGNNNVAISGASTLSVVVNGRCL